MKKLIEQCKAKIKAEPKDHAAFQKALKKLDSVLFYYLEGKRLTEEKKKS